MRIPGSILEVAVTVPKLEREREGKTKAVDGADSRTASTAADQCFIMWSLLASHSLIFKGEGGSHDGEARDD